MLAAHICCKDQTGTLTKIARDYIELITGMGRCPLEFPEDFNLKHVPKTWFTGIGEILKSVNGKIIITNKNEITRQRENDQFIMREICQAEGLLTKFKQCRLYIQVVTLNDICTTNGRRTKTTCFHGLRRKSSLLWPKQRRPSPNAWEEWRRQLRMFVIDDESLQVKVNIVWALG